VQLSASPLAPGASPVNIAVREWGTGPPLVFLHGGWGYDVYPFDRQIAALASQLHLVAPDRSGYGGSTPIDLLPADFHQRAAEETTLVIDALGLERPLIWGHSDGAIIALLIGLASPDRIGGLIVEATHYFKHKPRSRAFFTNVLAAPRSRIVELHSRAWLTISDEARAGDDFYGGRLAELRAPVLVIHGARDPRTEPGELDALRSALFTGAEAAPATRRFCVLDEAAHSPHSEPLTADRVTDVASRFLNERVRV
jgi:pimeloyl-ACP methyl ester carboxylesterase